MQPKQIMKKSLLATALLVGLGNAFTASSETFTVTAGAIPDVAVGAHSTLGDAANSFGAKIKLNPGATTFCEVIGATNATDAHMAVDFDGDGTTTDKVNADSAIQDTQGTPVDYLVGDVNGTACVAGNSGNAAGEWMLLVINGGLGNSVTVDIPDVVGTGWTWKPGRGTCVTNFDGTTGADTCDSFAGINQKTGVKMAKAAADENAGADIETNTGLAKILLAGSLHFDGTPITGPVNETITVTVTYE